MSEIPSFWLSQRSDLESCAADLEVHVWMLKTKVMVYAVADEEWGSEGNMYPQWGHTSLIHQKFSLM